MTKLLAKVLALAEKRGRTIVGIGRWTFRRPKAE